jgi:hypothetical protein
MLVEAIKSGRKRCSHCQGIFIVTIADISALVFGIWATINQALSIVDIAILGSTAWSDGLRWVCEINKDQACSTCGVSGGGSNSDCVVLLLVNNNVVSAPGWKTFEVTSEISLRKGDRACLVDCQEL